MGDETGKKFSLQLYTSHQEIISPAFFLLCIATGSNPLVQSQVLAQYYRYGETVSLLQPLYMAESGLSESSGNNTIITQSVPITYLQMF